MEGNKLQIRPARKADMAEIDAIYARARCFMKQAGNPSQWGDSYPPAEMLQEDLEAGQLFVLEEDGRIQGVFALIGGEDPTYGSIDGAWLNDLPYLAIHRVASRGEIRGVTEKIVRWCFGRCRNLRIDTHPDNLPMQKAVGRCGFQRCGIIRYFDGSPRIAYQRTLTEEECP